ncbi:MAG: hypothetical protein KA293_07875 [Bacteroidia bacterium]|nr:hypothetical protein [Bacteroidia bacterium]
MAVTDMYWNGGSVVDEHLLWGQSSPTTLLSRIAVTDSVTGAEWLSAYLAGAGVGTGASVVFKPSFDAALAAGTYTGFGISVNQSNGGVSTTAKPGGHVPNNFSIQIVLTEGANTFKLYFRFHLHSHVTHAWLSPSPFKVPIGCREIKMAVFAEFDDLTIADISDSSNIVWAGSTPGKIGGADGYFTLAAGDAGTTLTVTATLPPTFHGVGASTKTATGTAHPYVLPSKAKLVAGSAGYARRNQVPNFLFLADGFLAEDEGKFDSIIDTFVTSLRQEMKLRPFNLLASHMNFWKVFVPSSSRGLSVRYEVKKATGAMVVGALADGFDLVNDSPAVVGDLVGGAWSYDQFLFHFGLPIPSQAMMSDADIVTFLKAISPIPDSLFPSIPSTFIPFWKSYGDRISPSLKDNFLGFAHGRPLHIKANGDADVFDMSPGRMARDKGLNDFLLTLQYEDPNLALNPLGAIWDFTEGPGGVRLGKDYDNVVVLLCSDGGRAVNSLGNLVSRVTDHSLQQLTLDPDTVATTGFAGGRAMKWRDLPADVIPRELAFMSGKTTLLHEICHSLGLDDEYGESGQTFGSPYLNTNDTVVPMSEQERHFSNVQLRSDLLTAGVLDAERIKWRWHRIEKSGIVNGAIAQVGAQYFIVLGAGEGAQFSPGDKVFLRRRVLGESLFDDVDPMRMALPRFPTVTRSPVLVVEIKNDNGVAVRVENTVLLNGRDLTVDFPSGSVLYKPLPIRSVDPNAVGAPFLELIAPNVMSLMKTTKLPLHEVGAAAFDDAADQNPDLGSISLPFCNKKAKNVVGLYAGGRLYHHGIYHPAGHCMMRDNHQIAELCSVCQYIITDFINPSLHPQVDAYIEEYYPMKPTT